MKPHEHYEAALAKLDADHDRRREEAIDTIHAGFDLQCALAKLAHLRADTMEAMYAYYFMPTAEPARRWQIPGADGDNGSKTQ